MDPFAAALDALFNSAMALDAVHVPDGGSPKQIRVIKSSLDRANGLGRGQVLQDTGTFDIRVSDVAAPVDGDALHVGALLVAGEIIGGEERTLYGDPVGDVEGLTWTIGSSPA